MFVWTGPPDTDILPGRSISRKQFALETIQKLYDLLQQVISKNPYDWEGWLYVHKWIDFEKLIGRKVEKRKSGTLTFNLSKYVPFIIEGKNFLLDKDTHLSYEIDDKILQAIEGKIEHLNKEELSLLTDKNILI